MHYYQFSIGDYRAATAHLSNEEDLAYRRLLDMYYDTEEKIPLDTQWVARRIRIEASIIRDVLNDMFVKDLDGWSHSRCDQVINQYHSMASKNRANGRLGGRKKNPVGSQVGAQEKPNAKATNNQELKTKNHIDTPVGVSVDVWQDFVKLRKAKKAPVTDNVVKLIQKEADLAGWSMEMALAECVVRGWQSFKADWVKPKPLFGDIAKTTVPSSNVRDPALQKLDDDARSTKPPPAEILAKIREFSGAKNQLL